MKAMFGMILALATTTLSAHVHNLVDLQVVDRDSGRILDVQHKQGRAYVAGEPGHRYAVMMQNRTGERVMAVLSVDGVNGDSLKRTAAAIMVLLAFMIVMNMAAIILRRRFERRW